MHILIRIQIRNKFQQIILRCISVQFMFIGIHARFDGLFAL